MVTKQPITVTEALSEVLLAEFRKRRLSHASMAKELGMGRDTFARRLDGPHGFTGAEMERIAKILDTSPSQLLMRAELQATASQVVAV